MLFVIGMCELSPQMLILSEKKERDDKFTLARSEGRENVWLIFYLSECYLMSKQDVGGVCTPADFQRDKALHNI